MSNTSTENEALIKDLMYKCDCLLQGEQQVEGKGVRAASWGCGKGGL